MDTFASFLRGDANKDNIKTGENIYLICPYNWTSMNCSKMRTILYQTFMRLLLDYLWKTRTASLEGSLILNNWRLKVFTFLMLKMKAVLEGEQS